MPLPLAREHYVSNTTPYPATGIQVSHALFICHCCDRWYDDFNAFKTGVRDLEVMLENVFELALDSAPSLVGTLELLEGFQLMAKREAVKRAVERHVSNFYGKFMTEINAAKKHFDMLRRNPPSSPMMPRYAGAAR